MTTLLTCIDGSRYADSTCAYAAWFAKTMTASVDVLHVLRRHSDYEATRNLSGSIGLGARSGLLEELAQVDERRGKLDQEKGKLVLSHAQAILEATGVTANNTLHRRGGLVDTIQELEANYDLLFVGKRGEHANLDSHCLGSNLDKVARGVTKPLFVATEHYKPIQRLLIAYDGKSSTQKAIQFIASHLSLSAIECHVIAIQQTHPIDLAPAVDPLTQAGFAVVSHMFKSSQVNQVIADYVIAHDITLLALGAYSHSPLRQLLLGSTTSTLILNCNVPMLLFR